MKDAIGLRIYDRRIKMHVLYMAAFFWKMKFWS